MATRAVACSWYLYVQGGPKDSVEKGPVMRLSTLSPSVADLMSYLASEAEGSGAKVIQSKSVPKILVTTEDPQQTNVSP